MLAGENLAATRANDLILYDRGYPALFTPGPHARQHCQAYGLATDPIPLRLIRVKLKSGEIEGLATSLLEEQTYPSTWFKHLYHLRWGVEEGYKREKCRSWVAQAIADRLYRGRQYTYRVNFAQALLAMATSVEAVRPDRPYPRKIDPAKLHPFHPNYKRRHEP